MNFGVGHIEQVTRKAELIATILETARAADEGRSTRLWSLPRLSHIQIRECLRFTFEHDLLEYMMKDRAFRTTKKGIDFLESYKKMCQLFSVF